MIPRRTDSVISKTLSFSAFEADEPASTASTHLRSPPHGGDERLPRVPRPLARPAICEARESAYDRVLHSP